MDAIPPPGEGPFDPARSEIDPLAFALNRVRTNLRWIEEHRATFEATRMTDPAMAEEELVYLARCTFEAERFMNHLVELLLAGVTINQSKRLPPDLAKLKKPT